MKLRTKIFIFLGILAVFIAAVTYYQSVRQEEVIDFYIKNLIEQKKQLFSTTVNLKGEPLKKVLAENSIWDDMVNFISSGDKKWAAENITTMLDIHNANYVWVYDINEKLVYSASNKNEENIHLPVQGSFSKIFERELFPVIYAYTNNNLIQIFGATIHPTTDFNRVTPARGYFFVAKQWDSKYIEEFEKIIDANIEVLSPEEFRDKSKSEIISFRQVINDPITNKPIANIFVYKDIAALKDIESMSSRAFYNIIIYFSLFSVLLLILLNLWFFKPLMDIGKILKSKSTKGFAYLKNHNNIFSDIYNTIESSYAKENEILKSQKKFKEMFDNHSAIMLLIDPETLEIVDANISAEKYYGYSYEELKKMRISQINNLDEDILFRKIEGIVRNETNYFVFKHQLTNGECRDVEVYSSPVHIDDKMMVFSVIHDITERKKIEEDLKAAKEYAENAGKAKSNFLSNMSHEIRTPLNAIIGLTDILMQSKHEDQNLENIKAIKFSADNLLSIVNDILDFSKIESGKINFEIIDFDIRWTINEIKKTFKFKAEEKGISFLTTVSDNVPNVLKGDPTKLNQILMNLAGNALKFTYQGKIEINVSLLEEIESGYIISIKVSDTGIGIPRQKLASVFESYTQAYSDTSRKFGGTGLGLAITKRLIEMQNGTISVESVESEGTTFSISIPYLKSEKGKIDKAEFSNVFSDKLEGVKLLFAEDNELNIFYAKQLFANWKINADIARNGLEALSLLRLKEFDLIIYDLQMPKMSGFELAEAIRKGTMTINKHTFPILALTADISPETRERVLQSGFDDILIKPFNQKEIFEKIAKYSGR